jgi:hypothetical protein
VSAIWGRSRGPCATCGPSERLVCPLALSRGLAVGDGAAVVGTGADGAGTLPPEGSSA